MTLSVDQLQKLEAAAYLCDGATYDCFREEVLPRLAALSEGELWALSGMFLRRDMTDTARFIAEYAAEIGRLAVDAVRPDPSHFLALHEIRDKQLRGLRGHEPRHVRLPFDDVVAERHARVAKIIALHLDAIKAEIAAFDPETLNIDNAGDRAEIACQVLAMLVDQLRGFGSGARMGLAQEERDRRELFGEDEDEQS
jgi:hypothetical protein